MYAFFTEQNFLLTNGKRKQEILFMSLRWKIPTSPHFSVQTDNSLINELLQPRPMGVATLWPPLPEHRRCRRESQGSPGKQTVFLCQCRVSSSVQGRLFVGGTKSGYYFKRNSHRKNVGFKINKCAHAS